MSSLLYSKEGNIHNSRYAEIYIPTIYFTDKPAFAINTGSTIETIGILYCRGYTDGKPDDMQMLNAPVNIVLNVYELSEDTITIANQSMDVIVSKYPKDSQMFLQDIVRGREVAQIFKSYLTTGKLPSTLNYVDIIDLWWKNMELAGVPFNLPSKMYESIIATIYRNPKNTKQRYGQYYASNPRATGHDYSTGNIRKVVANLSTASGMMYEDLGVMITNGVNNAINNVDETVSPLEKILYY